MYNTRLRVYRKENGSVGIYNSRYEAVQDPIAMVSEAFVMVMSYDKDEKDFFRMTPTIKFEDASGRKYKQTFCIDIGDRLGNGVIINYAQPELCEE